MRLSMTTHKPLSKPYVVFGYGSLIFKPPPHVIAQVPGFLKGYVRRFAQSSSDHRGVPEDQDLETYCAIQSPGRVVTLIHAEDWTAFSNSDPFPQDDTVWGVAYTIDPEYEAEVREYLALNLLNQNRLDYREKDGYTVDTADVYAVVNGKDQVVVPQATVYVGRNDNPSFVGSEPLDALAEHIWRSVGPSGRNKDYLYDLATAVRKLAPESYDSHLFALEMRLKALDEAEHKLLNMS